VICQLPLQASAIDQTSLPSSVATPGSTISQGLGAVDARGLVTHVVPADRAAEVYELLDRRPAEALQVVLDFEGDGG
jgi:hypothetical protein